MRQWLERVSPHELTVVERVIFSAEPRVDEVARLGGGPSENPRARPGQITVLRFD
jgi:hypothetical protein